MANAPPVPPPPAQTQKSITKQPQPQTNAERSAYTREVLEKITNPATGTTGPVTGRAGAAGSWTATGGSQNTLVVDYQRAKSGNFDSSKDVASVSYAEGKQIAAQEAKNREAAKVEKVAEQLRQDTLKQTYQRQGYQVSSNQGVITAVKGGQKTVITPSGYTSEYNKTTGKFERRFVPGSYVKAPVGTKVNPASIQQAVKARQKAEIEKGLNSQKELGGVNETNNKNTNSSIFSDTYGNTNNSIRFGFDTNSSRGISNILFNNTTNRIPNQESKNIFQNTQDNVDTFFSNRLETYQEVGEYLKQQKAIGKEDRLAQFNIGMGYLATRFISGAITPIAHPIKTIEGIGKGLFDIGASTVTLTPQGSVKELIQNIKSEPFGTAAELGGQSLTIGAASKTTPKIIRTTNAVISENAFAKGDVIRSAESVVQNKGNRLSVVSEVPAEARTITNVFEGVPRESVSTPVLGYQYKLPALKPESFAKNDLAPFRKASQVVTSGYNYLTSSNDIIVKGLTPLEFASFLKEQGKINLKIRKSLGGTVGGEYTGYLGNGIPNINLAKTTIKGNIPLSEIQRNAAHEIVHSLTPLPILNAKPILPTKISQSIFGKTYGSYYSYRSEPAEILAFGLQNYYAKKGFDANFGKVIPIQERAVGQVPKQTRDYYNLKKAENIATAKAQLLDEIRQGDLKIGNEFIPRASIRADLRKDIFAKEGKTPEFFPEVSPTPTENYFTQAQKDLNAEARATRIQEAKEGIIKPNINSPQRIRQAYREGIVLDLGKGIKQPAKPYYFDGQIIKGRPTEYVTEFSKGKELPYSERLALPIIPPSNFPKSDVAPFRVIPEVNKIPQDYFSRKSREINAMQRDQARAEAKDYAYGYGGIKPSLESPQTVRAAYREGIVTSSNYGIKKVTPPAEFKGFIFNVVEPATGKVYYEIPKSKPIENKNLFKKLPETPKSNPVTLKPNEKVMPNGQVLILKEPVLEKPKVETKAVSQRAKVKSKVASGSGDYFPSSSKSQSQFNGDVAQYGFNDIASAEKARVTGLSDKPSKLFPIGSSDIKQESSSMVNVPSKISIMEDTKPDEKEKQNPIYEPIQIPESVTNQTPSQGSSQTPKEDIAQTPIIEKSQIELPITQTGSSTSTSITYPSLVPPPDKPNYFSPFSKKKEQKKKRLLAIQERRRGKFTTVGFALSESKAFELGKKKVSENLGASFRVIERGNIITPSFDEIDNEKFYLSSKEEGVVIQKNKFRLGQRSEVTEIQRSKKVSSSGKKSKSIFSVEEKKNKKRGIFS